MSALAVSSLLFNWDAPRRRNLAITGFLIASFFAHIACFYLFQVVYPPTVSLTPTPQRVSLISANTEEGATLLRWLDAEDPALATRTRRPSDAKRYPLGKIQHTPSYFAREPTLQAAPPVNVDLRIPSAQPAGQVRPTARPAATPMGVVSTKVTFSGESDSLGEPKIAPANFRASGTDSPQSIQFRIAVDPQGGVRHCLPLNSSGDAALDEQARQHLALCRFPARPTANDNALVWGIATIEWGNDVAAPHSKPTPNAP